MYTKIDSTMTIGDLIAGKDYSVVVYCGYDVEKDIPKATENKIGSVIGWFKRELVVVVDKKFFDGSELIERLFGLTEERRKNEC